MKVFRETVALKKHLFERKINGETLGLVPTMGAIHQGHLTLVDIARSENDLCICSIYVNPTQFNNRTDLEKYPRELEADLKKLENRGCDIVFCPSDDEMYPSEPVLKFNFGHLESYMEGKYRPDHFNGVALAVSKLFNIVQPDQAYFGQKDLQQFIVISTLVADLSIPVTLRCIQTVRETDGLAMSSRNLRLSEKERNKSVVLHQSLNEARELILSGSTIDEVKQHVSDLFSRQGVRVEYFEVTDARDLTPLMNILPNQNVALCVAAYVGEVRLIDNLVFLYKG